MLCTKIVDLVKSTVSIITARGLAILASHIFYTSCVYLAIQIIVSPAIFRYYFYNMFVHIAFSGEFMYSGELFIIVELLGHSL